MGRLNRIGGAYWPLNRSYQQLDNNGNQTEEQQTRQNTVQLEEIPEPDDSVIVRGKNLPIVDLRRYNIDGKEAQYTH